MRTEQGWGEGGGTAHSSPGASLVLTRRDIVFPQTGKLNTVQWVTVFRWCPKQSSHLFLTPLGAAQLQEWKKMVFKKK